MKKRAEQGHAVAQYNLGVTYVLDRGVKKDDKKAFEWFLKAAKQGLAEAQNNLGAMYCDGKGVGAEL